MLSAVQGIWPLIERGQATEAMAQLVSAFGELPELAGDGGSLVRLFHGQPAEMRTAALPLLPADAREPSGRQGVAAQPRRRRRRLLAAGHRRRTARLLYDVLTPWADLFLVDGIGAACIGSVELVLGELATLLEEYDAAAGHLDPRTRTERHGRGSAARWRTSSASSPTMLERRGGPGDAERRRELLDEALAFYRRAGIDERVTELEAELGPRPATAVVETAGVFRRDGSFWTVAWRGREATLPAVKGMADLAVLLAQPDRETHVLDLVGATAAPRSDLGEVIDASAKEAYRARLAELDERLADAEVTGDADTSEQVAREREFLLAELGAAYGLGGRARRAGDPAERARTTVTSRVRDAIGRIDAELPELGRHLRASVRTGTYCVYAPETPTTWVIVPTT